MSSDDNLVAGRVYRAAAIELCPLASILYFPTHTDDQRTKMVIKFRKTNEDGRRSLRQIKKNKNKKVNFPFYFWDM